MVETDFNIYFLANLNEKIWDIVQDSYNESFAMAAQNT